MQHSGKFQQWIKHRWSCIVSGAESSPALQCSVLCYPTLTEVNMTNATHPVLHHAALHPGHCRAPMPVSSSMSLWSLSGCRVRPSARWRLAGPGHHPPLSLASGHDDWGSGARRGEQARSEEGGGGAAGSVRGVTSQQSGVRRVMIPVRVMITPADGGTRHPAEIREIWLHQRSHNPGHNITNIKWESFKMIHSKYWQLRYWEISFNPI